MSLVAGLEARGAMVESFKVYRWDLPEDAGPLRANIKRLAEGGLDVAMFTSAQQVVHLLRVAKELGLEAQVRDAFRRTVVASVGPTTSEMLRANGLPVDFEPSHPKLGHLVAESAANAKELLEQSNRRRRLECEGGRDQHSRLAHAGDTPRSHAARQSPVAGRPLHAGLPPRAGPVHPHLADAAGRPLHGRVPRSPREAIVPRTLQEPQALQRSDVYRRRPPRRRRCDHLLRPVADPRTDGARTRVRPRRRAA